MTVSDDPWEVFGDYEDDRRLAIERGLRAHGYDVEFGRANAQQWPAWARYVYFAVDSVMEVDAVRAVAEAGRDAQDAVCAASALGGFVAVRGLVESLIAERGAQA